MTLFEHDNIGFLYDATKKPCLAILVQHWCTFSNSRRCDSNIPPRVVSVLEMAKQGIHRVMLAATVLRFSSRGLLIWISITQGSDRVWRHIRNTSWRNRRVRICGDMHAKCAHWRDPVSRLPRGSLRGSSFSEIFGGLHWFRIVFICRILKLERPPFVHIHHTHTMRGGVECQGEGKISKTNHARRSPRIPP